MSMVLSDRSVKIDSSVMVPGDIVEALVEAERKEVAEFAVDKVRELFGEEDAEIFGIYLAESVRTEA